MKFSKWVVLLVGAMALSQASAFPIAPINHQCAQSGYDRSMQDLFVRVNIIGQVDKRKEISKMHDQLEAAGFDNDDIKTAMTCGGRVFCPASGSDGPAYETANSLVSSDQVFIPAHLFFNLDNKGQTTTMRSNLHNCFFYNYANPADRIPLIVSDDQVERLHNLNLSSTYVRDRAKDGMKFKLVRRIPGCKPFGVDRTDTPMNSGDEVVWIGAPTPDMRPAPSGHEPAVQFCRIKVPETFESTPSVYFTNCSGSPGQSGSILLVKHSYRTSAGAIKVHWVAKAIDVVTGYASRDGDDFNLSLGSFSESVGIEGDHLRDVLNEKTQAPVEHMAEGEGIGI